MKSFAKKATKTILGILILHAFIVGLVLFFKDITDGNALFTNTLACVLAAFPIREKLEGL